MTATTGNPEDPPTLSVGAKLSRATVRIAMAGLQDRHGLNSDAAFEVLRDVSQRHNVKLRALAAGMVSPHADSNWGSVGEPPSLPFTVGGRPCANRGEVLAELMRVAINRSDTDRGTVQLHDRVHGGLQIEATRGFSQEFADTFSYLGSKGTPCGSALSDARQVVVADVDGSALFSEPARNTLLANEVRSCVSTPILDDDGDVRGIVSTHQRRPDAIPTDKDLRELRLLANQCGQWLKWYDRTLLPAIVAQVHDTAAARAGGAIARRPVGRPGKEAGAADAVSDAGRMLTDRYGVDPGHAREVLAAMAAQRGMSLRALAAQLAVQARRR
jgi:GAF domain/ANTAR domain